MPATGSLLEARAQWAGKEMGTVWIAVDLVLHLVWWSRQNQDEQRERLEQVAALGSVSAGEGKGQVNGENIQRCARAAGGQFWTSL